MTRWDDEGRPVEWVTAREPEWDAEDRALIFALLDLESDLCPDCGESLSESLHVDGRPDPQYDVMYAVCLSCKARERAHHVQSKKDQMVEKSGGTVFTAARKWLTKLRQPAHIRSDQSDAPVIQSKDR